MRGFAAAALVAALLPQVPSAGFAQGLYQGGGGSRLSQFQRQTRLMDSRLSAQYQQSARFKPGGADRKVTVTTVPLKGVVPTYTGRRSAYVPHARAAARKHGIPEDLFLRLVQQESGWNPNARSYKGARGLAQLMPGTAAKLGVNASDPIQNLDGGARYLRMMYNTFGDWRLALAAYNAGPGAVARYRGVPPYRETKNYVRVIAGG